MTTPRRTRGARAASTSGGAMSEAVAASASRPDAVRLPSFHFDVARLTGMHSRDARLPGARAGSLFHEPNRAGRCRAVGLHHLFTTVISAHPRVLATLA
jgi:hypothetical protein